MNIDIKIKNGEKFYFVDNQKVKSGTVDKIEIFTDYFRYVNEDKNISINWFTNDSIDNDRTKDSDSMTSRIFTTEQKAKDSYEFKHNVLHKKLDDVRCFLIEVKLMKGVKLFYPEEKLNEIQRQLDEVKSKYLKIKEAL